MTARPEQILQTKIVVALHRRFDCRCVHVPNGGGRTKLEALALRDMGVWAGHPDLIVYGREGRLLLIEVKDRVQARDRAVAPGERLTTLSEAQRHAVPELRARGFAVAVVDTVEDAVAVAKAAGFAPRTARPRPAAELTTGF